MINPKVAAVFDGFPPDVRERVLVLRQLVLDTARETDGVGEIEETLRWGEPAYLTPQSGSGSTIRLAWSPKTPEQYAVHFFCTTNLVERFRTWFPNEFRFEGNRSILFDLDEDVPIESLGECFRAALLYHKAKKR